MIQDRFGNTEQNEMKVIRKPIANEREMKQKEQLKSFLDRDNIIVKRKIAICNKPGTSKWITALP